MATIKSHPAVSEYHQRFDVTSATEDDRKNMISAYERGSIVFLDGCDFNLDFDLFDLIDIEEHPETLVHYLIAKLSMTDYLDILWDDYATFEKPERRPHASAEREDSYLRAREYLRNGAFGSADIRARLANQIINFESQVLDSYRKLFPEYGYQKYSINWRLTEARGESLHVDAYETGRDFHQLKLFINLDKAPRIWNTGERMRTLLARHVNELGLTRFLDLEYHRFLEECDKAFFDPLTGPRDCLQTHTTFFDQGETWIVETRQIPHQILFGRKMVSVQFYIKPRHRQVPEESMSAFVDAMRGQFLPA